MNHETLLSRWRANFLTGLAVVLPALVSIALFAWLFGTMTNFTDHLLFFLPQAWTHKDNGNGPVHWYWSLVALTVTVLIITVIGRTARLYFGKLMIEWADQTMLRIPLLNKIYSTVKQVNEALSSNKSSFKQVVLIPFPHQNSQAIGFLTSELAMLSKSGDKLVTVFIPTTPNPTSGFLMVVPDKDVTRLDISVAEGIKFIISIGAIPLDQAKAQIEGLKPKT